MNKNLSPPDIKRPPISQIRPQTANGALRRASPTRRDDRDYMEFPFDVPEMGSNYNNELGSQSHYTGTTVNRRAASPPHRGRDSNDRTAAAVQVPRTDRTLMSYEQSWWVPMRVMSG